MPNNYSGDMLEGMGSSLHRYYELPAATLGPDSCRSGENVPTANANYSLGALEKIFGGRDKVPNSTYPLWAVDYDSTAPAISVGGGIKLGLTRAFNLRLAGIDHTHTGLATLKGRSAKNNLQISSGFELRFGT